MQIGTGLDGAEKKQNSLLNPICIKKYEQPHISKSLTKLKSVGLIKDRREGMNVYYSLAICCMCEFISCLNKVLDYNSDDDK